MNEQNTLNMNIDKKLQYQVDRAATFNFENIEYLKDIFNRRQNIAKSYKRENRDEFEYLNSVLRDHLGL